MSRCSDSFAEDRLRIVTGLLPKSATKVLDIGCGLGRNLLLLRERFPSASLVGVDVAEAAVAAVRDRGFEAFTTDASDGLPFEDQAFDFVFCGEVIEHVVRTDGLLMEIRRVLRPDGILILTTPNLAYLPNRLLLLVGIQPLFTETSQLSNMGRRWTFLGQGRETQGHLKVFTLPALRDILASTGWRIDKVVGYRFFQSGIAATVEHLFAWLPSMSAGFVVRASPSAGAAPSS